VQQTIILSKEQGLALRPWAAAAAPAMVIINQSGWGGRGDRLSSGAGYEQVGEGGRRTRRGAAGRGG